MINNFNMYIAPSTPSNAFITMPRSGVISEAASYQRVGYVGKIVLWIVFLIMLFSTIIFAYLATRVPLQKRLLYVLTSFINFFGTILYFSMAADDAYSFVEHSGHKFRQVFWAQYISWNFTTPLLVLELTLLAGMDGASIITAIVCDYLMVDLGVFAVLSRTATQKWGYYIFSCLTFFVMVYLLAFPGRRAAAAKSRKTAKLFVAIGIFALVVWTGYPVAWILSDALLWSVDYEVVTYAILDVLSMPVFGFWLLFAHDRSVEYVEGFWIHGVGNIQSV
ncbi:hypothetical protein K3495_g10447 [Podosphaera aphanis]|nr:hypothetical protein K3495_g10447 [Podosphaera aphanis]